MDPWSFSQGSDHLTVTWKVDEGIYQHIDIKEQGKENAFSLGKSLWIENEVRGVTFKKYKTFSVLIYS